MKRIMFLLISVTIFFTACSNNQNNSLESSSETTVLTQIAPEEEFDGVLFGMTMEDVISTIGREPDANSPETGTLIYNNLVFFNIKTDYIAYNFEDNRLTRISAWYEYQDHGISVIEQLWNDYTTIKEELLKRYPKDSVFESADDLDIYTQDRGIWLQYFDNTICLSIWYIDNTESPDTPES